MLRLKNLTLQETVIDQFDPQDSAMDLAILYEVTGYQGENPESDPNFWNNYANFKDQDSLTINDDAA